MTKINLWAWLVNVHTCFNLRSTFQILNRDQHDVGLKLSKNEKLILHIILQADKFERDLCH